MSEQSSLPSGDFTVLTWNMLLDKTRTREGLILPQRERIGLFKASLEASELPLDVVALQEVALEQNVHAGENLARELGVSARYFFEHNLPLHYGAPRGRHGEHIGFLGDRIESANVIETGDNRRAVKTSVGSVAVVNFHLRQGIAGGKLRQAQATKILESVDSDQAVLLGDTNELPSGPARKVFQEAGFVSAFTLLGMSRPKTFPTPEYRAIMYGNRWRDRIKPQLAIDDIYVRGLRVLDAGVILGRPRGASDHYGLWANIEAPRA